MSRVIDALRILGTRRPEATVIADERVVLTSRETDVLTRSLAVWLRQNGAKRVGLLADNSAAWALWDLAALEAGITMVPLPGFFSDDQLHHIVVDAGLDFLISDDSPRLDRILSTLEAVATGEEKVVVGRRFLVARVEQRTDPLPAGIAKVTYTSGTTGSPKGVLLRTETMERVAASLAVATGAGPADRHLALLPLATLLENIAGIYAPLLAGGCAVLYGQQTVGVSGASGVDPHRLLNSLDNARATTAIALPQLLQALVAARAAGGVLPGRLRYLAVGGAPVSERLLNAAQAAGLPVFEGYGLSECASVVAVNRPGACRTGSVGKPLPHVGVRIAGDGEIFVSGALFDGYLHDPRPPGEEWPTGDLGHFDDEGYLHITGRKKNLFITAFGRNVAPEWVEAELTAQPAIAQAAVFGEAKPFNVAIIVPRLNAGETISEALANANRRLPDYAQVERCIIADEPFTPHNGLLTANGRPRREAISRRYGRDIAALYERAEAV
ncbi:MAG: AMP-dependent synthetase/ligase [Gammaproteobacteria bacterium]